MIPFPPFPSLSLCLSLPFPSVIIFFFHMIGGFDVFLTSRNIITHRPIGRSAFGGGIIRGFVRPRRRRRQITVRSSEVNCKLERVSLSAV